MGATDIAVIDGLDTNASELRAALEAFQAGVLESANFKVVPRGAGANRSIDLPGGRAILANPGLVALGRKYLVFQDQTINSDAFELGGIAAPHATYARLDQIILRLYDNEGGQRRWRPEVLKGADPTQNATLDSRHNATNLPAGVPVIRVADIVVPTTGIITATEIRDRRPWARGAHRRISLNSAGAPDTSTAAQLAEFDSALRSRLEVSSGRMEMRLRAFASNNTANDGVVFGIGIDGASIGTVGQDTEFGIARLPNLPDNWWIDMTKPYGVSAGSHLFTLLWRNSYGGTISLYRTASLPMQIDVREVTDPAAAGDFYNG